MVKTQSEIINLCDVRIIDVKKCDDLKSPYIKIIFSKVYSENNFNSLFYLHFANNLDSLLKLYINEPLEFFKNISLESLYNIRIENMQYDNISKKQIVKIIMVDMLETNDSGNNKTFDDVENDQAEPYSIDKDLIYKELMNKINYKKKETEDEITEINNRKSILVEYINDLKKRETILQENKNDLSTLEMTYKQLNDDI